MKVVVFYPKDSFTPGQQKDLASLGSVSYTKIEIHYQLKKY